MQMIMPDILVARRFVVLTKSDAITVVDCFHGKRNIFGTRVNVRAKSDRKVIDVFVVFIWDNQNMPEIVGHIVQTHESRHSAILVNIKGISAVRNFADDPAEWTIVVIGSMIVHGGLFKNNFTQVDDR